MIPLQILTWCALGYAGGLLAARKGYTPRLGILVAIAFGPLALIAFAVMPVTREGREQAALDRQIKADTAEFGQRRNCPECGREVTVRAPACPRCNHRFEQAT